MKALDSSVNVPVRALYWLRPERGNWPSSTSKSTYQCTLFLMASTAIPPAKANIRWLRHLLSVCLSYIICISHSI